MAEVPPPRSVGLLPAPRHRISPSWGQHIWPGLQAVWRQETLLWMEQVQSREHVLSVYHLSPTCGAQVSVEPIEAWKLERDGGLPPTHCTPGPPRGQLCSATRLCRQPFSSSRLLNIAPQPPALPLPTSLHGLSPLAPNSWRPPLQSGFSPGGRRPQGWCSHTRRGAHRWSRSGCGLSDTRSPRRRAARKGSTMGCSG